MTHQLGAHESISGGLACAIDRGEAVGADVVQIFTKSNHRWTGGAYDEADICALAERTVETGIKIVASHASYLINLATPDPTLQQRSIAALIDEIERCAQLRIPNLVVHPGAHVGSGEEVGLARVSQNLDSALAGTDAPVTVCLESTAGQGSTLGYRLEHLSTILTGAQPRTADRLGICLDTCHLFAAGYDLRDSRVFDEMLGTVEDLIGLNRLKLVHVNDSEGGLGSRKDRHAHVGEGEIGLAGFTNLLRDRRLRDIPMILETPKEDDLGDDVLNLLLLRSLAEE